MNSGSKLYCWKVVNIHYLYTNFMGASSCVNDACGYHVYIMVVAELLVTRPGSGQPGDGDKTGLDSDEHSNKQSGTKKSLQTTSTAQGLTASDVSLF